jgi:putative ABC transport system permease protein
MLRLAVLSARGRFGAFTGALIALIAAAVLSMAWGMQLESILRTHAPVERYAAATAVVTGQQQTGDGHHDVLLGERARVSSALTARLAAVPGVRAAIGDVSVPALLGGTPVVAHGWGSAALAPSVLTAGRPPTGPGEVVTSYPAALGTRLSLAAAGPARTVTVVGVARPRHPVSQQTAIFLTDAEAIRLAGHPGLVDAIGVLTGPGFDVARLRAAAGGAQVLTGGARGAAEYPELERSRTTLIPVTAAFGGLAMFIAIFVVAGTLGLSIQQREREIALMRAVAATPAQIRRMIAWEAAIVALVGSAAGIWPGIVLGRFIAHGLMSHGITPPNDVLHYDWLPAAAAIAGGVATALLAVLAAACRRRSRSPTPRPSRGCWDRGGSSAGWSRWPPRSRCSWSRPPPPTRRRPRRHRRSTRSSWWWRPPSSVRRWRTRSPGCWRRRSRRCRRSAGSWPPRTSAPPPGASPRPALRWCSPSP